MSQSQLDSDNVTDKKKLYLPKSSYEDKAFFFFF